MVLSHGNEGILYGYDHSYPAHKIWEPFTADKWVNVIFSIITIIISRSPSLAGKPKLFFIQACQGSKMDSGTEVGHNKYTQMASNICSAQGQDGSHNDGLPGHLQDPALR